jgi:hypothetical protein
LRPSRSLDDPRVLLAHRQLEVVAQVAHDLVAPGVDQRALDDREAALQQAQHGAVDQKRLGAHRTLSVEALVQPHRRRGDLRAAVERATGRAMAAIYSSTHLEHEPAVSGSGRSRVPGAP